MPSMTEELIRNGIRLRSFNVASHKTTCPKCSHTRKSKTDPCLWVNIKEPNLALWKCHNCLWTGSAGDVSSDPQYRTHQKREYTRPEPPPPLQADATQMNPALISFAAGRGISEEVLRRNKVYFEQGKGGAICFPYYVEGELANIKRRTLDKKFWMEKGAKLTFYGQDDCKDCEEVIIVEGEMDKLALEMAGYINVVSVPNGAPAKKSQASEDGEIDNRGAFEYVAHGAEMLSAAKKVYLAVDNDQAGENLRYELARRVGLEKCFVVRFPEKDANDTLMKHGVEQLHESITKARAWPIVGLYEVADFEQSLLDHFEGGMTAGISTGFENVDRYWTIMPGELTIVTGIPNMGKSEFVDAVLVNVAKSNHWRAAVFSPENGKEQHVTKLVEKVMEMSCDPKSPARISKESFLQGASWLSEFFFFIVADDEKSNPTVDWILDKARVAVLRYGISVLVIDPWNEVESQRPQNMTETEYVSLSLSKIKRFARNHGVHVIVIAHPTKIHSDKDNKLRVPGLYDISGSANWANKADNGIVIHRSEDMVDATEVWVKKVRSKHVGKRGMTTLKYSTTTGRYTIPDTDAVVFSMASCPDIETYPAM